MVRPLIAGNWKMNPDMDSAKELLDTLKSINIKEGRDVLICPPSIYQMMAKNILEGSSINVGAQNLYNEKNGAFTGEVSASMLSDIDTTHVLVGHSERREIFEENDDIITKKVDAALDHNLEVVLCCGETEAERDENSHFDKISSQIKTALQNVDKNDIKNIVIAYEPIWAIGTGKTASSDDAEEMCKFIRELLAEIYNEDIANNTRILYGGSVKAANISDIMSKPNINGVLVGGASLKGEEFENIINYE